MVAQHPGAVVGVDTHKDTHTAAALGGTGAVLEQLTVSADSAGYRRLIDFGRAHAVNLWRSRAPAASAPG